MFYCASPTSETCLFVSQLAVNFISYSVNSLANILLRKYYFKVIPLQFP